MRKCHEIFRRTGLAKRARETNNRPTDATGPRSVVEHTN